MPIDVAPRPLEEAEQRVLDRLLSEDFPGVSELRLQRASVLAQRTCRCGCASIDLTVDSSAPSASVADTVPILACAELPEPALPVKILLFVPQGRLSLLEIASYEDHVPDRWPAPESLDVHRR